MSHLPCFKFYKNKHKKDFLKVLNYTYIFYLISSPISQNIQSLGILDNKKHLPGADILLTIFNYLIFLL